MKNKFERFKEEICSNCKNKEKADCEIRKRIDETLYCEFYERERYNETKKEKKEKL